MHRRDETCIQNAGRKACREDNWGDLGIDVSQGNVSKFVSGLN
jgi:hypothetical protein